MDLMSNRRNTKPTRMRLLLFDFWIMMIKEKQAGVDVEALWQIKYFL
jgi:hypothetical protein